MYIQLKMQNYEYKIQNGGSEGMLIQMWAQDILKVNGELTKFEASLSP